MTGAPVIQPRPVIGDGAPGDDAGGQLDGSQLDGGQLDVTVIICAYTEARWQLTRAAVESVLGQEPPPKQLLLVIDHNERLAARAREEFPDLTVLESDGAPGLSGARNTGMRAAACDISVFLDDDAAARPDWLASLVQPYDDPQVVATGGGIYPVWPASAPRWMPPEFYWVVGCSYRGLPDTTSVVRNPIGANMSMRTAEALAVGGFDAVIGRVGTKPRGCEETELAIRLTASRPGSAVMYVPAAIVDHSVSRERVTFSYFMRRNWHEGQSKAAVVRLAGANAGLERERRQVLAVLPAAVLRDLRRFCSGDVSAMPRIGATVMGFVAAAGGYLAASTRQAIARR
jgi:Glycosyl transferase family 2